MYKTVKKFLFKYLPRILHVVKLPCRARTALCSLRLLLSSSSNKSEVNAQIEKFKVATQIQFEVPPQQLAGGALNLFQILFVSHFGSGLSFVATQSTESRNVKELRHKISAD